MLDDNFASTSTLKLAELHNHDIFCTPIDARYDRLTRLARLTLGMPIVAITAFANQRLWFKSVVGWDVRELPLDGSLSERTLQATESVVIEDTHADPTFAQHPLVTGRPHFRFYAGQSLCDPRGRPVGTFDLLDIRPRTLDANHLQAFHDLVELARKEILTADLRDAQVELVRKLDLARRQALIDPLTATWNRRAAMTLLDEAVKAADRSGDAIAVCVADVDNFKDINDSYGHPAGDLVLRKVARCLVSSVRDGDAVCRIGGDEFLILMERVGPTDAKMIATRLGRNLSQTPVRLRDRAVSVSMSTGTATRRPGEKLTADQLIQAADGDLYRTKHSDRATRGATR